MYAWFFRALPGPFWVRLLLVLVLLAATVLLLMEYVFPWVAQYSPLGGPGTFDSRG